MFPTLRSPQFVLLVAILSFGAIVLVTGCDNSPDQQESTSDGLVRAPNGDAEGAKPSPADLPADHGSEDGEGNTTPNPDDDEDNGDAEISYDEEGRISRIENRGGDRWDFEYEEEKAKGPTFYPRALADVSGKWGMTDSLFRWGGTSYIDVEGKQILEATDSFGHLGF